MKTTIFFTLIPFALASANVRVPRQTAPALDQPDARGVSPAPTPEVGIEPALFGRRQADRIVAYIAPDNTCGYFDGELGSPATCASTNYCMAQMDQQGGMGYLGCYNPVTPYAVYWMGCYDAKDIDLCTGTCLGNQNIVKCTTSPHTYCNFDTLAEFTAGMWACARTKTTGTGTIMTTYPNQPESRSWKAIYMSDELALLTGDPAQPATTTVTTTATAASSSGSSIPLGGIIGAAIGGFAVLSAFICAVLYMYLRARKSRWERSERTDAASTIPGPFSVRDSKYGHASAEISSLSPPMSPAPQPMHSEYVMSATFVPQATVPELPETTYR